MMHRVFSDNKQTGYDKVEKQLKFSPYSIRANTQGYKVINYDGMNDLDNPYVCGNDKIFRKENQRYKRKYNKKANMGQNQGVAKNMEKTTQSNINNFRNHTSDINAFVHQKYEKNLDEHIDLVKSNTQQTFYKYKNKINLESLHKLDQEKISVNRYTLASIRTNKTDSKLKKYTSESQKSGKSESKQKFFSNNIQNKLLEQAKNKNNEIIDINDFNDELHENLYRNETTNRRKNDIFVKQAQNSSFSSQENIEIMGNLTINNQMKNSKILQKPINELDKPMYEEKIDNITIFQKGTNTLQVTHEQQNFQVAF